MTVTVASGVPGVGSSRVTQQARKLLDDDFTVLNFGDLMLEESMARGLEASRGSLSELPVRDQVMLQRLAGETVRDEAREGHVIVDTHFVLNTDRGYVPGFPEPVLRDVHPDRFVLVEAAPSTILERRDGNEEAREYYDSSEIAIEFHQSLNRMAAVTYATYTSAPIHRVENEGAVEDAAEELAAIARL